MKNLRLKMTTSIRILAILTLLTGTSSIQVSSAQAVERTEIGNFGLGLVVGAPRAGISLKLWQNSNTAFAAAFGWATNYFRFQADYLKYRYDMINVESGQMSVYYGVGLYLQDWRSRHDTKYNQVGIRAPLGLNYEFASEPIELFVEVAPTITLVDGSGFDIDGSLGGRYYF